MGWLADMKWNKEQEQRKKAYEEKLAGLLKKAEEEGLEDFGFYDLKDIAERYSKTSEYAKSVDCYKTMVRKFFFNDEGKNDINLSPREVSDFMNKAAYIAFIAAEKYPEKAEEYIDFAEQSLLYIITYNPYFCISSFHYAVMGMAEYNPYHSIYSNHFHRISADKIEAALLKRVSACKAAIEQDGAEKSGDFIAFTMEIADQFIHLYNVGTWNLPADKLTVEKTLLEKAAQGDFALRYFWRRYVSPPRDTKSREEETGVKMPSDNKYKECKLYQLHNEHWREIYKLTPEEKKVRADTINLAAEIIQNTEDGKLPSLEGHFFSLEKKKQAEENQRKRARESKDLYTSALIHYLDGDMSQTYEAMLAAAELGHEDAYLWLLRQESEKGNADAAYQLGELYLNGTETLSKNLAIAFDCLKKAADKGSGDALWRLGYINERGLDGYSGNLKHAAALFKKSAACGSMQGKLAYSKYCPKDELESMLSGIINMECKSAQDKLLVMEAWKQLALHSAKGTTARIKALSHFTTLYFPPDKNLAMVNLLPADAVRKAVQGNGDVAFEIGVTCRTSECLEIGNRWLEYAAGIFSQEIEAGDYTHYTDLFNIHGSYLQEYSTAKGICMQGIKLGIPSMFYQAYIYRKQFGLGDGEAMSLLQRGANLGDPGAELELWALKNKAQQDAARMQAIKRRQRELEQEREQRLQQARQKEMAASLNAKLDFAERLGAYASGSQAFTVEERAIWGDISKADALTYTMHRQMLIDELKSKA